MLYLIKKELTANIRYMLMGFAIFIFYAFIFNSNGDTLFMLCFSFCFFSISNTNLIIDERYKIDLLMSTLPIRRKDIVLCKYLLIAVLFVICFILYTLVYTICSKLGYDKIPILNFGSAMLGLLAVSLLNGISLPLSYKFGANSMRYVSMLLFFIIFFLSYMTGNFNLLDFIKKIDDIQIGLILLAGALVINLVSFPLSSAIYSKKDFK